MYLTVKGELKQNHNWLDLPEIELLCYIDNVPDC